MARFIEEASRTQSALFPAHVIIPILTELINRDYAAI